jgi:hypothetical protein
MIKPNTFMNNLWLNSCGHKEDWSWLEKKEMPSYESLLETEWDEELFQEVVSGCVLHAPEIVNRFREYARNRMVMGAMRYGLKSSNKHLHYDVLGDGNKREKRAYTEKNLECLVDAYNIFSLYKPVDSAITIWCCSVCFRAFVEMYYNPDWMLEAEDDGEHCKWLK